MQVNVIWDEEKKVTVITYENAKIESVETYQEWQDKLFPQLDAILEKHGKKFPLAVGIDNLSFSKEYEARYGKEIAPIVAKNYATAIARFGGKVKTKLVVSNQAMKRIIEQSSPDALKKEYGSNIFQTKEDAIDFVLAITKEE